MVYPFMALISPYKINNHRNSPPFFTLHPSFSPSTINIWVCVGTYFFYPSVHSGSYKLYRENWWSSALRSYFWITFGGVLSHGSPCPHPKMTWMINWATKMHIDALQMALKWLEHLHSKKKIGHLIHRWPPDPQVEGHLAVGRGLTTALCAEPVIDAPRWVERDPCIVLS